MKKILVFVLLMSMILAGCGAAQQPAQEAPAATAEAAPAVTEAAAEEITAGVTVYPLPELGMDSLNDCIVNVALAEGAVFKDESGALSMKFEAYTYDKYDMVDISMLKEGDIIVMNGEEVPVEKLERSDSGAVMINGGLEEGGHTLYTQDSGIFYVMGYSDMKSWYLIGEAELPLSESFVFTDSSDLDNEPVSYSAAEFMDAGDELQYHFVPQNAAIRIENSQIVSLDRVYMP